MTDRSDETWRADNRRNWDERVAIHMASPFYGLDRLKAGAGRLYAIEEAELGPVDGLRLLHLQCHFGQDTLTLAQRGADCVGLDFSPKAIAAARELAAELGLAARFVDADIYDAGAALAAEAPFDRVFVTWGTIYWLPDIRAWAQIIADQLAPGGVFYFAEGHPVPAVFDDAATPEGAQMPGWYLPYFHNEVFSYDDPHDYADPAARLTNTRAHEWMHTLGDVVTALIEAGLQLEWLHEHDAVPWRMFAGLKEGADGMYRWPDKPWLPLSYSLKARKP